MCSDDVGNANQPVFHILLLVVRVGMLVKSEREEERKEKEGRQEEVISLFELLPRELSNTR